MRLRTALVIVAMLWTGSATRDLAEGREVTVSCAEGDTGFVYEGLLDIQVEETDLGAMPDIDVLAQCIEESLAELVGTVA